MLHFDAAAVCAQLAWSALVPALRAMFVSGCEVPPRHIHRLGERFVAVHTLLHAQFLPTSPLGAATVEIKGRQTSRIPVTESSIHWEVLHEYLDRYTKRETLHGRE